MVFRDKTAVENKAADENFADGLDATFDKDPNTQTNFSPFFFMSPPPKQTLIINRANGTQTKSEINVPPPTKTP